MSKLNHIFTVGQEVKYYDGDLNKWFLGKVASVFSDHIIVNIPEISDHCWFEGGFNLDRLYPVYN